MLHIRWNGRSVDVDPRDLGLRDGSDDREILSAAARYLDLDTRAMEQVFVDRTPQGDIVIRPEAVFG